MIKMTTKDRENFEDICNHPISPENRATRPVAQEILLRGPIMWEGKMYDPRAKHLGVGVYHITFTPKEFTP